MGDTFKKISVAVGLLLLAVAVASIAYYFVIALPRNNAAKLKFEQSKYEDEKALRSQRDLDETIEKAKKAGDDEFKRSMLESCLNRADEHSEEYVLLNGGEKTAKGTIQAPTYVWEAAEKKKKT